MLTTFENVEKQHLRRKERERHVEAIERIANTPPFQCLEETEIAQVADSLVGLPLAKQPVYKESTRNQVGSRRGILLFLAVAACVIVMVLFVSLLTLKSSPPAKKEVYPTVGKISSRRYNVLLSMILDWGVSTRSALEDDASAQGKALYWLAFNDTEFVNSETIRTRFVLSTLYFSTSGTGSQWHDDNHWLTSYPVCLWYGIECFDESDMIGLVKSINLSSNGLAGTLPLELALLERDVRLIDLSFNSIGSSLPDAFYRLNNLKALYLGPNNFKSTIPQSVYGLSHLTHLYLNDCQFSGTISGDIGVLTNLQGLDLHSNRLIGRIPDEVALLTELRVLYLDGNFLSSTIPVTLPNGLVDLRLRNNRLTGTIPADLASSRFLQILYLDSNELDGEVPPALGSLPLLLELQLHNNRLRGSLPRELGFLEFLAVLYADGNFLTGQLPDLGHLRYLESLYLFGNGFSGPIPSSFGSLSHLKHLRLNENKLTGHAPPELGKLSDLQTLYVNNNTQLSGQIPTSLNQLGSLIRGRFHGNDFTGDMNAICQPAVPSLVELTSDCNNEMSCSCCTLCYH